MELDEFTAMHGHCNLKLVRLSRRGNQIFEGDYLDSYDIETGGGYAWPVYVYLVVDPKSGEILVEECERGEEYMY